MIVNLLKKHDVTGTNIVLKPKKDNTKEVIKDRNKFVNLLQKNITFLTENTQKQRLNVKNLTTYKETTKGNFFEFNIQISNVSLKLDGSHKIYKIKTENNDVKKATSFLEELIDAINNGELDTEIEQHKASVTRLKNKKSK